MTSYSILAEDWNSDAEYLPCWDTSMVQRGSEWGDRSSWVPVELPELLSGSDYMGGSVTVSNCRVFLDRFGDRPDVRKFSSGWFGDYGVLLGPRALADEEIKECLDRLADYIVIDEDDLSAVEFEAESEAWERDYRRRFLAALQLRHIPGATRLAELEPGEDAPDPAWELFHTLCERSNTYWENETGNSAYVDIDRVVARAGAPDVARALGWV